ncbi:MAG: NAD/NADP octopine/nopaline dehydrogenase family protein [Planctomycetota bacterium]
MAENIDRRQVVALCGGGSSAHILIAMSGRLENVDVRAWVMESELEAFRSTDELLCDVSAPDSKDSFECRGTATFDSDPANVIPGADVVIFCGPISVYPAWMKGIAPHVGADTIVGGLFLQGIHLPAMGRKLGFPESTTYFGFGLYPFASRIVEFGSHVKVLGAKTFVNVCTTGPRADDVIPFFRKLIATPMEFRRQPHFLACVLSTTNALTHPARMHGIYKDWDGPDSTWAEKDLPLFYEEMDEYSATSLERLNEEALQVRDAIVRRHPEVDLSAVKSRLEVFQAYGDNVGDSTSLLTCYRTNLAYKGITVPVEATDVPGQVKCPAGHRYFQDDIPFGLCVFRYLADLVNVSTPEMDCLIEWGQKIMDREYLVDGELDGKDVPDIPIWGYTLEELIAA